MFELVLLSSAPEHTAHEILLRNTRYFISKVYTEKKKSTAAVLSSLNFLAAVL